MQWWHFELYHYADCYNINEIVAFGAVSRSRTKSPRAQETQNGAICSCVNMWMVKIETDENKFM
jgi:hypothetical protein